MSDRLLFAAVLTATLLAAGCAEAGRANRKEAGNASQLLPAQPPAGWRHDALEKWIQEAIEPLDVEHMRQETEELKRLEEKTAQ